MKDNNPCVLTPFYTLKHPNWIACFLLMLVISFLPALAWAHPHTVDYNKKKIRQSLHHSISNNTLLDAINQTHYWLHFRLRHERVDLTHSHLIDAYGTTLRTAVGFETGYYHYFNALVEGANISIIGPFHYNSGRGSSAGIKLKFAVIPDPNVTLLSRALVHFIGIPHSVFTVGRQYINLDNQRFVGTVGFRQNLQRFDSVSAVSHLIPHTTLYYAYIWQVNRIFGPKAKAPFDKFNTGSQLINIKFNGLKYGDIIGYSYLLANNNAKRLSSNTVGIRLVGTIPIGSIHHHAVKLLYTAEIANQTDAHGNPIRYSEKYYHLQAGLQVMSVTGLVGYEVLDGNGTFAFQTPYATLHKFNGWADLFLFTPSTGLADGYANLIIKHFMTLSGTKFIAAYHDFHSRVGHQHYGNEYDVGLYQAIHKHFGVSVEYANFHRKTIGFPNVQKVWLTLTANFG